jgi:hypothetical protein
MCGGNAYAWDEEIGYAEGEEMEIEYVEGYHYFEYHQPQNPNWYDPLIDLWIRIKSYLFTDEEIEIEVSVIQETWTGSQYEPKDPQIRSDNTRTLTPDANQSSVTNMAINPIEEFFKNNTDAIDDFKTRDDDQEHPDILNVSLNITGAGLDIHEYGYTTLDDEDLQNIGDQITNPDYGFALDGRGGDGASGSIYEGINMYGGTADETGMGKGFGWIFFGLIPIIFIFAVFKFCKRIL